MMAPGARDHHLAVGISVEPLAAASRDAGDDYMIPMLRYELSGGRQRKPVVSGEVERRERELVLVYIHGGGLLVGEADSEDLSCRRLVKHFSPHAAVASSDVTQTRDINIKLYSIGYRLMPQVSARTCISDVDSAFKTIRGLHPAGRYILVGSSSGGELAALLSQSVSPESLHGVLLRCPVTVDAPSYTPARFVDWHTSASQPFVTSLLGIFHRQVPRDGLERMPLEAPVEEVRALKLPPTWIQVCTNDVLYSDGVCYAKLLQDSGTQVRVDVVQGWPHTFWLKAPHLTRALGADEAMLEGLDWILGQIGLPA
jgi:acetyl esterase/lipase